MITIHATSTKNKYNMCCYDTLIVYALRIKFNLKLF